MSVNLVSSESEEEPDESTPVTSPCCRAGLYIAQTTLTDANGQRLNEMGLFTSVPLNPGAFVGLYNGHWWDVDAYEAIPQAQKLRLDRYSISTSGDQDGEIVVSPPLTGERPNPQIYPLSMSNEPSALSQANCVLQEYSFLLDEVDVDPDAVPEERQTDEFIGAGLMICRRVGKNRELYWHYGNAYPRPYRVGRSCRLPPRNQRQDPLTVLELIPRDACSLNVREA